MEQNKYMVSAVEVLRKAKEYLGQKDWTQVSKKEDWTVLKKKSFNISQIPCYILESVTHKPAQELVSKIWDVNEEIVKKNDHEIASWQEIEKGPNWKVCNQTNSAPWPIWPRELVFYQAKIQDNNTTWLVASSIEHPNVPLRDTQYVRANVIMSIWGFTPIDQNKTKVCRIMHVEPKGDIPVFLVTSTVNKHVKIIEDL